MSTAEATRAENLRDRWGGRVAPLVAVAAVAALSSQRFFQMDEFVFVRAAWLVARGEIPYRDFFEHHTPAFYALLAIPLRWAPESSAALTWARLACLPLALGLLMATAGLARRLVGSRAAAAATLGLVAVPGFLFRLIEVRPDLLAAGAFVACVGLLAGSGGKPTRRAALAGILWSLAVLSTQKALYYAWGPALLALVEALRSVDRRKVVPAARVFVGTVAACIVLVLAALAALSALAPFWEQNVELALAWQGSGGSFPVWRFLGPVMAGGWPWFALLAVGIFDFVRRRRGSELGRETVVWLTAAVSGALSLVVNPVPWPYNFLPVFPVLVPWVGMGLERVGEWGGGPWRRDRAAAWFLLLAGLVAAPAFVRELARGQGEQRRLVDRVLTATRPTEAVFDSNGGYLFRPSAYWIWYHSAAMRRLLAGQFEREVVPSLLQSGAVAWLEDDRFLELPAPVQQFVRSHYQRFDGALHLWGQAFAPPATAGIAASASFLAPRSGIYLAARSAGAERGTATLSVDGVDWSPGETRRLEAGPHRVVVRRDAPGGEEQLFVLWLPADGVPWAPMADNGTRLYADLF